MLTLLTGASFQVPIWIFLTYLMQRSMGYSPVQAGLGFIPLTLATVVVGVAVTPRLLTRMQPRHIIVAGAVFAASGIVWQAWVSHDSYLTAIAGPTIVIGIGGGLMNTPLATAVTSGIDAADAGAASGLMNTSKQFGGALGLAALGLITSSYTDYRPAFVAMAACMGLVAAGAAVALTPARPRVDANATTVDR
ncbi:MAG: MFS transporter [Rhodococcus sp. (in: high G+C Gram-positive bacteria)]